jgi:hypothetical protein
MNDGKAKGAVEVIHPPNKLKGRVGSGSKGALDPNILARAEAAATRLQNSVDFAEYVGPDLAKLAEVMRQLGADKDNQDAALKTLFNIVHDMRGGGANFGYPLVTQIGGLLCKYLEGKFVLVDSEIEVVRAHVDALRAVITSRLKGDGGAIGQQIVKGLEKIVVGQ